MPAPAKAGDAGLGFSTDDLRNAPKAAGPRVKHGATGIFIVDSRVRPLAGEMDRDYKSVHREVAMLTATGLIERRAADKVGVGRDRAITELDLAA